MHQGIRGYVGFAILAATLAVTTHTQAGEVLRLKAGTKTLSEKSQVLQGLAQRSLKGWEGRQEFVVQFKGPITGADKKSVQSAGFKILSYIPDDALVVFGDASKMASLLKSSSTIKAAQRFEAEWKQSSNFEPLSVFNSTKRLRVHVRLSREEFLKSEKLSILIGSLAHKPVAYSTPTDAPIAFALLVTRLIYPRVFIWLTCIDIAFKLFLTFPCL
jgi:hypothetical protein